MLLATLTSTAPAKSTTTASERDRLISDYVPLVRAQAGRFVSSSGVPFEDLVAYGMEGLLAAATRFDVSKGIRFGGFAICRIRGAMLDGIRQQHWLSRRAYEHVRAERLQWQAVNPWTDSRPANDVGGRYPLATDARSDFGFTRVTGSRWNGLPLAEIPVEPEDSRRVQLDAAIASLPEKERQILHLCYFEDKSLVEAGAALGMQRAWACRLHARAIATLRALLSARLEAGPEVLSHI